MSERTFAEKMVAARTAIGTLAKDGTNEHFKYDYVTEAAVKRAVGKALSAEGLYVDRVVHEILPGGDFTHVLCRTSLTVTDGNGTANSVGLGSGTDKGDKAAYKAMAGGLKYALTSMFLIPTGDDAEADDDTDKTEAPAKRPSARAKPAEETRPEPSTASTQVALLYATRIANADTEESLRVVATALSKEAAALSADDYNTVKAAFKSRLTELKGK